MDSKQKIALKIRHARWIANMIILVFAVLSLLVLQFYSSRYAFVTMLTAGMDAILCIALVMYIARQKKEPWRHRLFQQGLHWAGFLAVLSLVMLLHQHGTITQIDAGLFTLVLLSFNLYLAGLYVDIAFLFSGVALALMALGIVLIKAYLLWIMPPLAIVMAIVLYFYIQRDD